MSHLIFCVQKTSVLWCWFLARKFKYLSLTWCCKNDTFWVILRHCERNQDRDPKSILVLFLFPYTHFHFHGFFLCRTAEQFEPIRLHMGGKAREPRKKKEEKIKKYRFPLVHAKRGTFGRESRKWTFKLHMQKKISTLKNSHLKITQKVSFLRHYCELS